MSTKILPNNSPNLYLSKPILKLNGVKFSNDLRKAVLEIVVEESLHMPSMFILKIHNVYDAASEHSEPWQHEKYFNIGDRLSIGFTASVTGDPIFQRNAENQDLIDGEITGIEVNFAKTSEAHIIVTGYDVSHRLHRGRYNRSFLNCTDSDIVQRIAKENKIKIGQVDMSGVSHEYVFQENQTNMEFLRERAARIGFEIFVQNNKLYFRNPKSEISLAREWLKDINSFHVRVTSAEQVSAVEVNSWDYSRKNLITQTATQAQIITNTGNGQGSAVSQVFTKEQTTTNTGNGQESTVSQPSTLNQPPKMIVVDQPVNNNVQEATQMAQALYNELSGEFVTADARAEGDPEIRPGKVILLKNMGVRYSGQYYVTETRHRYSKGVFKTDFAVRGLRQGTLLSTLPPKTHLQPGQTLLVGLVTNNRDPQGWGRVKVKYPTLSNNDESQWARVVGLGASMNRGFYCLPEINDEVLIGFEHGDIHRPYVIGGVWNGVDTTVEPVGDTINQAGQVRLRTIKTRTGHTVQFVEDELGKSKAGIYITTKDKHRIILNDSQQFIELKTAGKPSHSIRMDDKPVSRDITIKTGLGHQVKLSETPTPEIAIKTVGGQSLTFSDISRTVTLTTPGGIVNIAAATITMEAVTNINMTAPTITMEGIINMTGPSVSVEAPNISMISPLFNIDGAGFVDGAPIL